MWRGGGVFGVIYLEIKNITGEKKKNFNYSVLLVNAAFMLNEGVNQYKQDCFLRYNLVSHGHG
jgi:hypothetical protein